MKPTLIIVDDMKYVRDALHRCLMEDFEIVASVDTAEAAICSCAQYQPELVLLDVVMPKKSGIEAAREISKQSMPPKIVILSGIRMENVIGEAFEAGIHDYLFKPWDKEILIKTLWDLSTGK